MAIKQYRLAVTLKKTLNIWSFQPLDISKVPPCQLSEILKHSWQHLQKGTNLQEASQKTYQAVALKLPSSIFPTPEYFPSSADQAVEASMTVSCSIFDLVGDFEEHFDCIYCQAPPSHQQQRTCPSQALEASLRESTADCSPTAPGHKELPPTNCTTNRCTRPTASDQATDALRTRWYARSDFGQSCCFRNNQIWESKSLQRNIVLLLVNCE